MSMLLTSFNGAAVKLRLGGIGVVLAVMCLATAAHGAPLTFAQFDESGNDGTEPFTFTNGATTSSFDGTTQGNFTFLVAGLPSTPQAATITLTSTAATAATGAGPFLFQPIDGATNTLTFTRVSDNANLLTVTFTGTLSGFDGDDSATLSADTAMGDTDTYTSDFLNFSGTTERSFGVDVSVDPALTQNDDGFLDNFAADLSGGFSSTPGPTVIPEPRSAWLGLVGMALFAVRRKRAAKA